MSYDQDEEAIPSYFAAPLQLESMRKLLGMSHAELALLLGGASQEEVRNLERPKTRFVYTEHESLLLGMMEIMNEAIEDGIENAPMLPFLITYREDAHLVEFDPALAEWMRFATVHRMFVGRVWWGLTLNGIDTTVVALDVPDYMGFLMRGGLTDDRENRREWASKYAASYTYRIGLPTKVRGDAEQQIAQRASWNRDGVERPRRGRERLKGETTVI